MEVAKRTYSQSVAVTTELVHSVRVGRSPNIKKIKRVVQTIVDQILNEETSLMGLTTIRDYDEYTFTHSVNVCIFSVALGRRLGLSKIQLYDLGLAALFHDIGKSRVAIDVLNKSTGLTDDEWRQPSLCDGWTVKDVAAHLTLQQLGFGDFLDFIEKQPGGLKALVAAERQARRPEPKADTKGEVARARLRTAPSISLNDVPAEEEFAVVVTRRGADGTHEPVAIVDDEALIERAIRRTA